MKTQHKIQREQDQTLTRKAEKHEALLAEVAADARRLAGTYLKETVVPEGGE